MVVTIIREAKKEDLPYILALLEGADLPREGVSDHLDRFLVAESGKAIAGAIGLEATPPDGLLRSLVVDEAHRKRGVAAGLCDDLIRRAETLGLRDLYLLTLDAAAYFERHGFRSIEREAAPGSIRRTDEFSRLCPVSATLMKRVLGK